MAASIMKRQLTATEAKDFSHEITLTPNIIGYRPDELARLKNVLVSEVAGASVGILAYVETDKFIDLKLLIVKQDKRGKGYGRQLMGYALKELASATKPMYSVTRNPIIADRLRKTGFQEVRFYKLPLACQLHQLKMAFSFYRMKEFLRKSAAFPRQPKFAYYIKLP